MALHTPEQPGEEPILLLRFLSRRDRFRIGRNPATRAAHPAVILRFKLLDGLAKGLQPASTALQLSKSSGKQRSLPRGDGASQFLDQHLQAVTTAWC